VRKGGNLVRITAQSIDALTGTHLWADRFDGPLEDIFALQDQVAIRVAGVIEPALQVAETARSANRPTNDLTAYDLHLRAYSALWTSARQIPHALRLLEQAIARDPRYGPALAVALNPNSARSWALSAYLRIWAGQLEIAMEHHETSDRLNPRARVGTAAAAIGGEHFLARRFDKAVPKLLLAIQEEPSAPQWYRYLAACYAHMGRLDEAREIIGRLRTIAPIVISDVSYMRNREQREPLLSGLCLAMAEMA
jgi:tetratricopeptide (TPR) repeat protein